MNLIGNSFVLGTVSNNQMVGSTKLEVNGSIFSYQRLPDLAFWRLNGIHLEFLNKALAPVISFYYEDGQWIGDLHEDKGGLKRHYWLKEFDESWRKRKCSGRKLIYIIAIGEFYHIQTRMLVKSLYKLGKYDGEILIFCENDTYLKRSILGLGNISLKVIDFEKLYKNGRVSPKIVLGDWIQGEKYDRIMFLDCDILCFSEIEGLFSGTGFSSMQHLQSIEDPNIIGAGQTQALSAEEHLKAASTGRTLNGGTFCLDGKDFNQFMKEAYSVLTTGKYRMFRKNNSNWVSEETALVKMFYNTKYKNQIFSPYDINITYSRHASSSEILYHYMKDFEGMVIDYFKLIGD